MALRAETSKQWNRDEGRWGRRAIKPRVCIGFSGTYTCAAVVPRGLSRGRDARDKQNKPHKTQTGNARHIHCLCTRRYIRNTGIHADKWTQTQANTCMHERTYVFSRRVVYPLGLVTDLHEMVQLVKKLLTGTMDLDTTPAQHRSAKGSLVSSRTSRVCRGISFFLFFFYCVVCRRECVSSSCR